MPTYSRNESSVDFLDSQIHKCEANDEFDKIHWKSLKTQLAATSANDLAGVAAKLCVVQDGIQFDADQLDLDILRSAITDLRLLSRDR